VPEPHYQDLVSPDLSHKGVRLPQFFTRSTFGQPQPQVAQLPFSQFGGQRPILPTDTTGGLPFPDAGQPQPAPTPLSPFRPTGLSEDELNALLGRPVFGEELGSSFLGGKLSPTNIEQRIAQVRQQFGDVIAQRQTQTVSSLPTGDIPFEGGGGFDKFNPVMAGGLPFPGVGGGLPLSNVNLAQPPNLSTLPNQNKLGGFLGGF